MKPSRYNSTAFANPENLKSNQKRKPKDFKED